MISELTYSAILTLPHRKYIKMFNSPSKLHCILIQHSVHLGSRTHTHSVVNVVKCLKALVIKMSQVGYLHKVFSK